MQTLAAQFPSIGYNTMEIDIDMPSPLASQPRSLLTYFESELSSQIRLAAIPFRPVIFARSAGALIAQTYISSHPASALVLIAPTPSTSCAEAKALLPNLQEFNYEPRFPILILDSPEREEAQRKENRLLRNEAPAVDFVSVNSVDGQGAFVEIQRWLDSIGV
ncbi:uncharacterized protein EI90DRAFT_2972571 [Cantharellus anzutake]|uniref:uncharacterized protein n=1 Tax=Cantharellus anzutake TaxID=1750568 RepID=UPI00190540FF|nr:uncharacterized protein EI90DRAFT_2972571 [Cantharellus anzutake]KAF8331462.1 hypothetical protein EI90DRAFT_2972571 [Cantharellus anzutake]